MFKFLSNNLKIPKILTYSMITNTCFGTFLRVNADVVQQNIEYTSAKDKSQASSLFKRLQELDMKRTMNIGQIGILIGPLMYLWYQYLDKILPGKAMVTIIRKIFLDQIVGGIGFVFLFINGLCLMDGLSVKDSLKEFIQKFPFIYMMDWLVWPPAQFINFFLVPTQFRVAFVNIILFCWNIFLSYMKYDV